MTDRGGTMSRPTDLHRLFIQTLLSRRVMREEVGLELYKRAISVVREHDETFRPTHAPDAVGFGSFINQLGTYLEEFGMDIKKGREDTGKGKSWIALVNTRPNKEEQASDYTPPELTYFRSIVTEIIESYPANSIGSIEALRISGEQETKMTKLQAEALLGTFVSRGWLAKSKRGRYGLAPRGIFELESWLEKEFPDLMHRCPRCSKLVLSGLVCATPTCKTHYHGFCYDTLVQRSGRSAVCSSCTKLFSDNPPKNVGEKAIPRTEDDWSGNRKRKRPSRGGAAREIDDDDDDEEEEEDDENEDEPSQSQSQSQVEQIGAGPSGWAVASGRSKRGRPSTVVPETQFDED